MSMITPRQSLSKSYLKSPVSRPEIERFKAAFVTLQEKINPDETEEHLKNDIRDFLLDAYYKGDYEINVKDRKDLVIHNGPKTSDSVGVILEAKSVKNTSEMVTKTDLNKKALRELILYYLREREDEKNINIKHLVITNSVEWFIFDENEFEKLVFRNVKFLKQYKAYKLSGKDTRHFYEDIAKPFIETIKDELTYTWFDISQYKKYIVNDDQKDDVKLVALYKLISPTHILKKSFANDSNSLNRNFYNELLHIIGLEEVKEKGKKIIQRKSLSSREPASLLENAINILKYETSVPETKHYDTALALSITWINRILFLKLLESQLVKYHQGDTDYRFLNYEKIKDYDTLNRLFFQVLAIRPEDRRPKIKEAYAKVPYLNSSLFEVNVLEGKTLKISNLEDTDSLSIDSKTVLKNAKGKRLDGKMNTLEYLFKFLEAYNFSSEGGEQIQEENKSLINASVLGLIFEKINGYKDGSFFTPGFITMYMCKETIRRAVIQKFNDHTTFESEDWDELKNFIGRPYKKEDLQQYNHLIDEIKICDPAVGSGHFLVSALNEIIAIKSELQLLCDVDLVKLPIIASVDNDELIIQYADEESELFEYDFHSSDSRNIQKALFEHKQKIIENCLFGVDINPNSVKICRLRLWIELLKNAYYTEESQFTDLETLPNIDINIKCGNSLISRFSLDSDLKPALKKSKFSIDSYKVAVACYKEATNKEQKQEFKNLINGIKSDFRSEVRGKELLDLQKLEGHFYERFGAATLLDVELSKTEAKKKAKAQKKLQVRIDKKRSEIEEIKNNKVYEIAFEWRFEFPEVLDDEGNYVGFDVVIGNPPYIRQEEFSALKPYLDSNYEVYQGTADIYVYFVERAFQAAAKDAQFVYIIPNKWMRAGYGKKLRSYLLEQRLNAIYDFGDLPVFEEATTYPCIVLGQKSAGTVAFQATEVDTLNFDTGLSDYIQRNAYPVISDQLNEKGWTLTRPEIQQLLDKIRSQGVPLGEYVDGKIFYGIKTGLNEAFVIDEATKNRLIEEDPKSAEVIKPFLAGKDIKRYESPVAEKWLILFKRGETHKMYGVLDQDKAWNEVSANYPAIASWLKPFEERAIKRTDKGDYWWELRACAYYDEFEKEKIMLPDISNKCQAIIDNSNSYCVNTAYIIPGLSFYEQAILNSRLILFFYGSLTQTIRGGYYRFIRQYLEQIPIKPPEAILAPSIISKVKLISTAKCDNLDEDTSLLEAEIDQIVYQLYDLIPEEIAIIEENT